MATIDKTDIQPGLVVSAAKIQRIIDAVDTWVFKHVPINGLVENPDIIKIVPTGVALTNIYINDISAGILAQGSAGNKDVPVFVEAANYSELIYDIKIQKEQEEEVILEFGDGSYPRVDVSGNLYMKLYRSQFGRGYNGGLDCYCTITIAKI